jgi:hypothetical protein
MAIGGGPPAATMGSPRLTEPGQPGGGDPARRSAPGSMVRDAPPETLSEAHGSAGVPNNGFGSLHIPPGSAVANDNSAPDFGAAAVCRGTPLSSGGQVRVVAASARCWQGHPRPHLWRLRARPARGDRPARATSAMAPRRPSPGRRPLFHRCQQPQQQGDGGHETDGGHDDRDGPQPRGLRDGPVPRSQTAGCREPPGTTEP